MSLSLRRSLASLGFLLLFLGYSFSQSPPIFSLSFEEDFRSEQGEDPISSFGVELLPDRFGMSAKVAEGDILQYPIAGNIIHRAGSLSLWVKPLGESEGALNRIFVFGDNPRNFEIHHDENLNLAFSVNTWSQNDQTISLALVNPPTIRKGVWSHLTFTWNSELVIIYLNGLEVGRSEVGYDIPQVEEEVFHIGSLYGLEAFEGLFDEVQIFDESLSSEDVATNYANLFEDLPPVKALSVVDRFDRDVTLAGLTLVDWEGPIRNPAIRYSIKGPQELVYPLDVVIRTEMPLAYFDLPSQITHAGASKSIILENATDLSHFYMSVFMDEDSISEDFELELIYEHNGMLGSQIIDVNTIDQDRNRELSYPVYVDFSESAHPFFQNDTVRRIIREATEDWAYYIDGDGIDTYEQDDIYLDIMNLSEDSYRKVYNKKAFDGFYLFVFGTDIVDPCICSTGAPSKVVDDWLQKKNGEVIPIPRLGGHILNVRGNFNENGYILDRAYDNWKYLDLDGRTDLYSLSKHEIGHAMVYEFMPIYNDFIRQNFITSSALEKYYPGGGIELFDWSVLHLHGSLDPESLAPPYASGETRVPTGRDMLTKTDVLIMEAIGYPLRSTTVTDSLSAVLIQEPGKFGESYEAHFEGRAGVPLYQFEWIDGDLPEGLDFDGVNTISGVPKAVGLFPIKVIVRDYSNNRDSSIVELTVHILRKDADLIHASIEGQIGETIIDSINRRVEMDLAEGSDLSNLSPFLVVSPGASVTPEIGSPQDFSEPVPYKITSEDGSVSNSWEIQISSGMSTSVSGLDEDESFRIYPNPAQDHIYIDLVLNNPQEVEILLYNLKGQQVARRLFGTDKSRLLKLETRQFSAGTYTLILKRKNDYLLREKVIVSK